MISTRSRTFIIDGKPSVSQTQTFGVDISKLGLQDIRSMLVDIIARDTAIERRAGNEPTIVDVDGSKSKPIAAVNKRITVLFGTSMPVVALERLKAALIQNIQASTTANTGKLSSPSSWEFTHIRAGRKIPLGANINFGPRDFVILKPKVSYATAANKRVAAGSRSLEFKAPNARKGKTAKRNQRLGFMAMTARQARHMIEFLQFSVTVGFTRAYKIPGEVSKQGTAYLIISPRRKRGLR